MPEVILGGVSALGQSQERSRVPQDAKVEAPSLPNDTHEHQNPQKINFLLRKHPLIFVDFGF